MRKLYTFLGRNTHKTNETGLSFGSNFGKGLILMLFFIIHSFGSFSQKSFDNDHNSIGQNKIEYIDSSGIKMEYIEVVEKRDEFSTVFQVLGTNKFVKRQSSDPLHYKNSLGQWQPISNDLNPNEMGEYTVSEHKTPIKFISKNGNILIGKDEQIRLGSKYKIRSSSNGAEYTEARFNGGVSVDKNSFLIKDLYKGTDLNYVVEHWGVKSSYLLNSSEIIDPLSESMIFEEEVILQIGWSLKLVPMEDGGKEVLFLNEKGIQQMKYMIPLIYDSSKDKEKEQGIIGDYVISKINETTWSIQLIVPTKWLLNSNRVFPIIIDPNVVVDNYSWLGADYYYYYGWCGYNLDVSLPGTVDVTNTYLHWEINAIGGGWISEQRTYVNSVGGNNGPYQGSGNYGGATYYALWSAIGNGSATNNRTYTFYASQTWQTHSWCPAYIQAFQRRYADVYYTIAAPSYCTPYTNSPYYMGISQVVFNTINNTSGNTNYTYQNFTNLSTNVEAGSTTNLFIAGWGYEQYATVWVDLNDNLVFEASERLATGVYMGYNCNIGITIPNGTSLGNHRMRIRTQYYYDGVQYDPCATTNYGETEDYTINITAPCAPPATVGFGTNTWNVLGYEHGGYNYGNIGSLAGNTFKGYYTDATVDINSQARWISDGTPSSASGWTGCPVSIDNHTVVYKRQGFPTAFYQIDLNTHDDGVQCYVNGTLVYQIDGCCADRGVIWSGVLCSTSTVEFRVMEGGGGSNLAVDFIESAFTAGTISGTQTICPSGTSALTTSGNTGGTWTTSNAAVATVNSSTGLVTAIGSGSATTTYTVNGGTCGNVQATYAITVLPSANAGVLSGTQTACVGATTTFTSNGTAGGTWSSDNSGIASINASTGVITGVAAGTATITYTVLGSGGCPNVTATQTVTISVSPTANAGSDVAICAGQSTVLSGSGSSNDIYTYTISMNDTYGDNWNGGYLSAYINGSWVGNYAASGYGSSATVNLNAGQTIYFTYTGGSWESENYYTINLNGSAVHSAGTYPPTGTVYTNNNHPSTFTYSWSPSTALNSTSLLSPTCSATAAITYTLTVTKNGCSATDQVVVSMRTIPGAPTVSGNPTTFCPGNTTQLAVAGLAPSGQAFQGNGSNSYIKVYQDIPEYNFTTELWMKTAALNTGIFGVNEDGGGHDRHLYLNNGQLWARVWQGNGWNTGVTLNDDQWHHIALTVQTGVGQKVYVDGNLVATYGYDHSDFNWQTNFHIGYSSDMGHFNGLIDNVRIWNTVRTQAELSANMYLNAPIGAGLVANYLMEGNANATTAGNNGTAYNNNWVDANFLTYAWSGAGAPSPSLSQTQVTSPLFNSVNYTVSASGGGCQGIASAIVPITVNNPTLSTAPTTGDMVWRGGATTDWATLGNWWQYSGTNFTSATNAPTDLQNVIIPAVDATCVLSQPNTNANAGSAKSLRIENGATLTMGNGTLSIAENMVNNGTFTPGPGTVAFTGSGNHSISGSAATHAFNNLTMNKNGEVILSVPIIIAGSLTLTNGNLNIDGYTLNMGSQAIIGGSTTSYVKTSGAGELKRNLAVGTTTLFPIGRSTYNPVELVKSGSSHIFGVRVADVVTANGLDNGTASTGKNMKRMWHITPEAGYTASNGAVSVSLIYENNAANFLNGFINGQADRQMFHFGGTWENITSVTGTFATDVYAASNYFYCTQPGVTNFSPFTISNFGTALPIELISFQANCAGDKQVAVTWSTASEHNTSHFVVEKSRDGVSWATLNTLGAAGNSTTVIDYSLTDTEVANGITYYRLTQFDLDGASETFNIASVNCGEQAVTSNLVTYPNPSNGSFYIDFYTQDLTGPSSISVFDSRGVIVYRQDVLVEKGSNVFHIEKMEAAPGMYYIQVSNGTTTSYIVKHSLR